MSVADWMPHDDGLRVLRLGKSANAARLSLAYIKKKVKARVASYEESHEQR